MPLKLARLNLNGELAGLGTIMGTVRTGGSWTRPVTQQSNMRPGTVEGPGHPCLPQHTWPPQIWPCPPPHPIPSVGRPRSYS